MPTRKKRVAPWLTLSVAQGNALQLGGLLGAAALVTSRKLRASEAAFPIREAFLSQKAVDEARQGCEYEVPHGFAGGGSF